MFRPFPNSTKIIMKKNLLLGTMALLAGSLMAADSSPKDDVKNAAAALGSQTNYSWHAAVESPNGGGRFNGPTDGKTEKGGYTYLSMTRGDNTFEAALKGTNGAVKSPDNGWQSLAQAAQDDGSGGFNATTFLARSLQNYKTPALQAVDLVNETKDLKKDTNGISGDLTESGAKAMLTLGRPTTGENAVTVANPKGSATFWVADGKLVKYQFHITGTVSFNGNDRDVDRTTTVEIKDVNATKIDVPADATKKLE
jgi:hypothetical protein